MKKLIITILILCMIIPYANAEYNQTLFDFTISVAVFCDFELSYFDAEIKDREDGGTAAVWNNDDVGVVVTFNEDNEITGCLITAQSDKCLALSLAFINTIIEDNLISNIGAFTIEFFLTRSDDEPIIHSFTNGVLYKITKDESGKYTFIAMTQ